jgi:Asp-tRNA(Asn)/Glu-tRNA(Gln) amidotransferase A subunit family amidase
VTRSDLDLAYLPASQLTKRFAQREISPVEVVKVQIARAQKYNEDLVAFGDCYFDAALRSAGEAEKRWFRGNARPLEGITLAVKDAQNIAGQRTTYGSLAFESNVPDVTDPTIERLQQAGAIVLARTTTSELCLSGVNRSSVWGLGRNPWNRACSPGGSSGGSAAALAAGFTTLATGTDMGGSIRVPASACGLVGYKPPHGRNPEVYPNSLDMFCVCGPLARNVADVITMQSITAGQHWRDPHSLPKPVAIAAVTDSVKGLKVAYSLNLSYRRVDPDVRHNTLAAADLFRFLGCQVDEVDLGWTSHIDRICVHWFNMMWSGRTLVDLLERHPDLLPDFLKPAARDAQASKPCDLALVYEMIHKMNRSFGRVMADHDLFLCPTMTVPAVRADQDILDGGLDIDGEAVDPEFGYSTTHQFNMLGTCPVASVPSGMSAMGVPTGLQIVGRPFDDATVLRAALAYEEARGPWYLTPETRPSLS